MGILPFNVIIEATSPIKADLLPPILVLWLPPFLHLMNNFGWLILEPQLRWHLLCLNFTQLLLTLVLMLSPLHEVQVWAFLVLALLFWLFNNAPYNYTKCCMFLSYLNICYPFIGCVKIIIVDLFVMTLVFGFRTRSRGMSFSRACVVMVYILSLSLFLLVPTHLFNLLQLPTIISIVILVNRLKAVSGTSGLVIPLITSRPLFSLSLKFPSLQILPSLFVPFV